MQNKKEEYSKLSKMVHDRGLAPVVTAISGMRNVTTADINEYKKRLKKVIENSDPDLVAVEYRERSEYYNTMSTRDYEKILRGAIQVCKEMEVDCTNGGIEDEALILLGLEYFRKNQDTDSYDQVFESFDINEKRFFYEIKFKDYRQSIIDSTKNFLEMYKKLGLKYVNIHWSERSPDAIKMLIDFLDKEYDLDVVSTEVKLPFKTEDAEELIRTLRYKNMKYIVWYFPAEGPEGSLLLDQDEKLTKLSWVLKKHNVCRLRAIFMELSKMIAGEKK